MNILDYAHFYAEKNWRVFPCQPHDKKPLVNDWPHEATTEINKINGWWEFNPNANIGIATGEKSKIFVVDIDKGHGGEESLASLVSQHGLLPTTPIALTGNDGRHIFFQYPSFEIRNSAGKLGLGLDVRGEGGYVCAAPSIHPNGNAYRWSTEFAPSKTPIAVAPEWMIMLLEEKKQAQPIHNEGAYTSGQRNSALTSIAGTMRRRGFSEEAIFLALNVENLNKCVPPLSEDEVREIAVSVSRYGPQSAPITTSKDRVVTEWAFIKSVYEFPSNLQDFLWLTPEKFGTPQLSDFWREIVNHSDLVQAATNTGILADIERFKDYDVSRMDSYAKQIERFAYLSKVETYGITLQQSAHSGDDRKIDKTVLEICRNVESQTNHKIVSVGEVAEELENDIRERSKNPKYVWGIHYAWDYLSLLTGGKQKCELIICAGEPKVGKSWLWLQDALETAVGNIEKSIDSTPVYYWCGEMKRKQLMHRFYQLLGVNGRKMKTGSMTSDDWDKLAEAKAIVMNSPIYIDDTPLDLHDLRPLLIRQVAEHGIEQVVLDYALKIHAPGKDEIEKTGNISNELKEIANELNLSIVLITSVNKQGMDSKNEESVKSNIRGSGQQIHDADVIYTLTKFNSGTNDDMTIKPYEYDNTISLHVSAARELDHHIKGGFINYQRKANNPGFIELKNISELPKWIREDQ